jgi:hypothetical protein
VVGLVTVFEGTGAAGAKQAPPRSSFDLDSARAIADFPVYYAGTAVEGHPLTAVLRRKDAADYVAFVYGDCIVESDTGCAPPAEIQVWPACIRNLSLYDAGATSSVPTPDATVVRGAPGAFFDDGRRLEIQTGRATVVIFSASRTASLRIASALRGLNVAVAAGGSLPSPVDGAVEGRLRC